MIMTFGKHKGKSIIPVEDFEDCQYLDWLFNQDFVKEQHKELYKFLKKNCQEIRMYAEEEDPMQYMNWYDFFT